MLSPLREGNLQQISSRNFGKFLSKKRGIGVKKGEIDSYMGDIRPDSKTNSLSWV